MNIYAFAATMLATLLALILLVAVLVFAERRILGWMQDRLGPNRAGPQGLMQPIADSVKLLAKEVFIPPFADKALYVVAPLLLPLAVLLAFVVIPVSEGGWFVSMHAGLLFVLALSAVSVYSIILGGWASNSKYPVLGALRTAAQLISYELPMGLALVAVVLLSGSFSLVEIARAQSLPFIVLQPLGFMVFFICGVAEVNRLPFDLPEAENELASGYNTEYGGVFFAMFYLGEYMGVLLISALVTVLYLGAWHGPLLPGAVWFVLKTLLVVFVFFWLRTSLPRLRYDQLMSLGWKVLLPMALLNLFVTVFIAMAWRWA